jgi:thiol-disulfide isomerase/thioredoxin
MLNRFHTRAISLASPLLVLGFFSFILCPTAGNAFERRVLLEDFTSTTCGPCAQFAPTLVNILDAAGNDVVPIAIHVWWPGAGNDPWWLGNQNDNRARVNYYGVNYVPWFEIDGSLVNTSRNAITNAINNDAGDDTPIGIIIDGDFVDNVVTASVDVISTEDINNLTLFVALQERYYNYNAPNGLTDHYDAMVMMLPDGDGTSFNIDAGDTLTYDLERNMFAHYWHDLEETNLRLVAWVQASDNEVIQARNFLLGIDTPLFTIPDWATSDDVDGDNDGRAERGETVNMVVTIANDAEYRPAENLEATLSTDDPGIEILTASFQADALESGADLTNADAPLQFRVADDFAAHPVTFNLHITSQPGDYVADFPITFMVEWPPFLIVDATTSERAGEYVITPFGLGGLPWADRLNTVEDVITSDLALNYDAILWHTFNAQDAIITEWDQEVLTGYLDDGGMLILSGSHIATALDGTDLMEDYLGVSVGVTGNRYSIVKGIEGDPQFANANLFLGGGKAVDWPRTTTTLNPRPGAAEVLRYERNGNDMGAAGVRNETDTYRTLFLSFPIESIGGTISSDTLETFLGYVNAWVQSGLAVPPDGEPVATEFTLEPAYPNPFNGQTVVPFSLTRDGVVDLTLFDLAGRKIADVANSRMTAGRHQVTLNAGALMMPNGIYTLQLLTPEGMRSQKLLYLR